VQEAPHRYGSLHAIMGSDKSYLLAGRGSVSRPYPCHTEMVGTRFIHQLRMTGWVGLSRHR